MPHDIRMAHVWTQEKKVGDFRYFGGFHIQITVLTDVTMLHAHQNELGMTSITQN